VVDGRLKLSIVDNPPDNGYYPSWSVTAFNVEKSTGWFFKLTVWK